MPSTIFYRLFKVDNNQLVWLFCEWDKLLPENLSPLLWGKPIYICASGPAPRVYDLREKNGQIWTDLKQVFHPNSEARPNHDVDIVGSLIHDFGVTMFEMWDISPGFVGISRSRLVREVPSHSKPLVRRHSMWKMRERLSSIMGVKADRIGFAGSQAIGLEKQGQSDWDVAVNLQVSEMKEFEDKIWELKRQTRNLQRKKFGMHFPYRLVVGDDVLGETEMDMFPKMLDAENHLLAGAAEWARRSGKQRSKFCIKNVTLGAEGWPVLLNDSDAPIIILCNGFRGVFRRDDIVTASCFEVDIRFADRVLRAWVIDDPFRDIENAKDYFRFQGEGS
ncbi:MAG: hypothetical protein ACQET3_08720 [Promethearchaeati archaeon]